MHNESPYSDSLIIQSSRETVRLTMSKQDTFGFIFLSSLQLDQIH